MVKLKCWKKRDTSYSMLHERDEVFRNTKNQSKVHCCVKWTYE